MKSQSYKKSGCCGGLDCEYENDDEICWGEVQAVDEYCTDDYSDCWWIHACKGHRLISSGEKYFEESPCNTEEKELK